jgi:outer membrane biosynthesis protein TonB
MKHLLALLLSAMSSAALAQTTGAVNPNPAPAQPSVNEDVPPGGCMPIGLTTSGEIVFPIQCKEFIERHRGGAVEEKPAAAEDKKPAVEEKSAAKQPEEVPPETSKPAEKPVEAAPLPKPAEIAPLAKPAETAPLAKPAEREPRPRATSAESGGGCQHYRTYDRASGTYRGYDGRVRPCR